MVGSRPWVVRWLLYAYGKRLPPRYAQWVLHDLTCRTWFIRVLARGLAQSLPALALLAFPAPASILAMMVGIVVFGMLFYSTAFAWEIRDRRLYPQQLIRLNFIPKNDGHVCVLHHQNTHHLTSFTHAHRLIPPVEARSPWRPVDPTCRRPIHTIKYHHPSHRAGRAAAPFLTISPPPLLSPSRVHQKLSNPARPP